MLSFFLLDAGADSEGDRKERQGQGDMERHIGM